MERKTVSTALAILLSIGALAVTLSTQTAMAQGIIYIRADGSVDPPTAPITGDLDVYTFTDNIHDEIVIEKSDIIVDGAGYNLTAPTFYDGYGLSWSDSDNVTVQNINIQKFLWGVYMYSSSFNKVTGNNITDCGEGVVIDPLSSNNTISGNTITNSGWYGIELWNSSSTTVFNNTIIGTGYNDIGVLIDASSFNIVSGNNITSCGDDGVGLYDSIGNVVFGNNVIDCLDCGIYLESSANNTISDNNIENCQFGIHLVRSSNNMISRNSIENTSQDNIILGDSSNDNTVSENNISNSLYGLSLEDSSGNSLRSNTMLGNKYGFFVWGNTLSSFVHHIDTSNKVEGKPIYYLMNQKNLAIDSSTYASIGYLAVVNSTNITVRELQLQNNTQGILFAYTTDSKIENNVIVGNLWGLTLASSSNVTVSGNELTDFRGVYIYSSSDNIFSGNQLRNCVHGIDILQSSHNTVLGNNVTKSGLHGLEIYESSNNVIYHNNFVDNAAQIGSDAYPNALDAGYPLGGNYWSDYTGLDLYKGPFQNLTGSDGLGDGPRIVNSNNRDQYPLMTLWSSWKEPADSSPPLISNIQRNPPSPNYDEDVIVSATVTDNVEVDQVFLFYRQVNGGWHNTPMNKSGNSYNATISPQPYGPLVQYRIYANDTADIWAASELSSYAVIDDVKPEVTASRDPMQPRENHVVKYFANASEPINASGVKTVTLHYRVNSGSWLSTGMTFNAQSNLWEISIVGQQARALVEYYVTAQDNAGNENTTETLSYTVALAGDVNLDHVVDVLDAAAVSAHWYPGPPIGPLGYDPFYDVNGDGAINIIDASIVSSEWNQTW